MLGNEITKNIVEVMILAGDIPENDPFEITTDLLNLYYQKFVEIYPVLAGARCQKKPSNIRYFKKLAGLTLMKMSLSRIPLEGVITTKPVKLKSGILYLISNPVFPGMFKIGITQDLTTRLLQYQTYDPYRKFKVDHYMFVDNMRKTEKEVLYKYKIDISKGEWVDSKKVKEVFTKFV
jgi:hypothetical protein